MSLKGKMVGMQMRKNWMGRNGMNVFDQNTLHKGMKLSNNRKRNKQPRRGIFNAIFCENSYF